FDNGAKINRNNPPRVAFYLRSFPQEQLACVPWPAKKSDWSPSAHPPRGRAQSVFSNQPFSNQIEPRRHRAAPPTMTSDCYSLSSVRRDLACEVVEFRRRLKHHVAARVVQE